MIYVQGFLELSEAADCHNETKFEYVELIVDFFPLLQLDGECKNVTEGGKAVVNQTIQLVVLVVSTVIFNSINTPREHVAR